MRLLFITCDCDVSPGEGSNENSSKILVQFLWRLTQHNKHIKSYNTMGKARAPSIQKALRRYGQYIY